jgi:hypothetical protein
MDETTITNADIAWLRQQIKDLRVENASLKQPWISVKDRMPETEDSYLVVLESVHSDGKVMRWVEKWVFDNSYGGFGEHDYCTVTHWMPKPEPPESEDK